MRVAAGVQGGRAGSWSMWSGAVVAQTAPDAVYRFYNRETGTHFYTASLSERDDVIRAFAQFAYEGAAFAALSQPRADSVPGLPLLQQDDRHALLHDVGVRARRHHRVLPAVRVRRSRVPCAGSCRDRRPHGRVSLLQQDHGLALLHGLRGRARQGPRNLPPRSSTRASRSTSIPLPVRPQLPSSCARATRGASSRRRLSSRRNPRSLA